MWWRVAETDEVIQSVTRKLASAPQCAYDRGSQDQLCRQNLQNTANKGCGSMLSHGTLPFSHPGFLRKSKTRIS